MEARTPHHLTTDDLAELSALHPSTVVKRRIDGDLPPASGAPGRLYWPVDQLLEWVAERTAHLSEERCRLIAALRLT